MCDICYVIKKNELHVNIYVSDRNYFGLGTFCLIEEQEK